MNHLRMNKKIYAIILAAGEGSRMGSEIPKQFLLLKGRHILRRSIESIVKAVPEVEIITVLPYNHMDSWKKICVETAFDCPQRLVPGGLTRFLSVRNALSKVPDGAVVMIHDGVRPFVSAKLIERLFFSISESSRAVIPVLPVTDTLRSVDPSLPAPQRDKIVAVQTPQVFFSEDIKRAYNQAFDPMFTDDATVTQKAGIPISFCEGDKLNIKITTPEDLVLGEAILTVQRL